MHRPFFASGALLLGATAFALSGCGSSNTTSSGAGTTAPTSAPAIATSAGAASGSSFCMQAAAAVAQLSHIGAGFASTTPGATPDVASIKQLFVTADSAVDSLDSSAPSQIATAFHTLRAAYDQANTQVQAATTIQGLSSALSGLSAVSSVDSQISTYLQTSCGISTPSP